MAAIVYIVILAMWAAVLLPMWARHRDESRSLRTVDHFRRALATLSDDPGMQQLLPTSEAMGRRRKVYASLLGFFVLLSVLWTAHLLPAGLLLLPIALAAAFTIAARKQVLAENRQRDAAIRYLRARSRCMTVHPSRADAGARPHRRAASVQSVAARPAVRMDDGVDVPEAASQWSARPLTLPTYVTAPAASAVPRRIDVASDGDFNGDAMLRQAETQRRQQQINRQPDFIDEFLERTHILADRDEVFDQHAPARQAANG